MQTDVQTNVIKLVGTFLHLLIVNTPKKYSEVVFNDPVSWSMLLNTKFLHCIHCFSDTLIFSLRSCLTIVKVFLASVCLATNVEIYSLM